MNEENIRVSIAFARDGDLPLLNTGGTVLTKIFTLGELVNPPVTAATLEGDNIGFSEALADMGNGGKLATANKKVKRAALVSSLKQLAAFVQMKCQGNMPLLLATGFEPVNTNRSRVPLPPPVINRIAPGMTGQTILGVETIPNVRSWLAEYAMVGEDGVTGEWVSAKPATSSRKILIEDQTSGRVFAYRVRAVGGTNGVSDWSHTVTARAA